MRKLRAVAGVYWTRRVPPRWPRGLRRWWPRSWSLSTTQCLCLKVGMVRIEPKQTLKTGEFDSVFGGKFEILCWKQLNSDNCQLMFSSFDWFSVPQKPILGWEPPCLENDGVRFPMALRSIHPTPISKRVQSSRHCQTIKNISKVAEIGVNEEKRVKRTRRRTLSRLVNHEGGDLARGVWAGSWLVTRHYASTILLIDCIGGWLFESTESVNFLGLEVFLAPPTAWSARARNQPWTPKNWGTQ